MPTESHSEERRKYEEYLEKMGKIRPDAVILLRGLERASEFNFVCNVSQMLCWSTTLQGFAFWRDVYVEVKHIRV